MERTLSLRAMTEEERGILEKLLRDAPARWKVGLGHAVVMWAASMLLFVLSWGVIGWILRVVSDIRIGWKSSVSLWLPPVAAVICAVYAIYSTLRWLRTSRDRRTLIRRDLAEGKVSEERLKFVEAKLFQEPEHGGLMYFLRTTDDRVFVVYDYESQDLAVGEKDPFSSSLRPKSELLLVRTPNARFIVGQTSAGDDLPTAAARELNAPPKKWPEPEEFCCVPWNELERVYG